jgi:hypothetical protein
MLRVKAARSMVSSCNDSLPASASDKVRRSPTNLESSSTCCTSNADSALSSSSTPSRIASSRPRNTVSGVRNSWAMAATLAVRSTSSFSSESAMVLKFRTSLAVSEFPRRARVFMLARAAHSPSATCCAALETAQSGRAIRLEIKIAENNATITLAKAIATKIQPSLSLKENFSTAVFKIPVMVLVF